MPTTHPTDTPLVIVSVLNWNGYENTIRCLESLRVLDYAKYKIVLVDNGSGNDSVVQLRRAFPDVPVVEADDNIGYAAGNRLALEMARQAGADLFWILNPDALAQPDTLSALVSAYQKHGAALYGSVPVSDGMIHLRTWALKPDGQADLGKPLRLSGLLDDVFPTRDECRMAALSGSSFLIPMSIIEQFGFIGEEFFLYAEELDYSLRLAHAGVPSYLVPASVVRHPPQGAHKHFRPLKPVILYYQTRNRLTVLRRYGGTPLYLWSLLKHLGYALAWAAATPLKGRQSIANARMTLRGVIDAVHGHMGRTYSPEAFLSETKP